MVGRALGGPRGVPAPASVGFWVVQPQYLLDFGGHGPNTSTSRALGVPVPAQGLVGRWGSQSWYQPETGGPSLDLGFKPWGSISAQRSQTSLDVPLQTWGPRPTPRGPSPTQGSQLWSPSPGSPPQIRGSSPVLGSQSRGPSSGVPALGSPPQPWGPCPRVPVQGSQPRGPLPSRGVPVQSWGLSPGVPVQGSQSRVPPQSWGPLPRSGVPV